MSETRVNQQLEVADLRKLYPVAASERRSVIERFAGRQDMLHAVDGVSFSIDESESVGLVGELGCGKSTIVRLISRLVDPTSGSIRFRGHRIDDIPARQFPASPYRREIQVVFQDPTDSLNPRYTAAAAIADPLRRLTGIKTQRDIARRVVEVAKMVGLPLELLQRFPHQLSGGQKSRVGIGRAIAVEPSLLILDEPTSALDVSIQAIILHLLSDLRKRLKISFLFVSHDLNVVRLLCDRVIVMYLGKIVEIGSTKDVLVAPIHPYTKALVSAIPDGVNGREGRIRLVGEPRSPVSPDPSVCRFFGRCPQGSTRCTREEPLLRSVTSDRVVACHFASVA